MTGSDLNKQVDKHWREQLIELSARAEGPGGGRQLVAISIYWLLEGNEELKTNAEKTVERPNKNQDEKKHSKSTFIQGNA